MRRLDKTHQQVGQGALAGAVGAGQGDGFAGLDFQAELAEHLGAARVGEGDVTEFDLAAHRC